VSTRLPILLGAGGHASVVLATAVAMGLEVAGVCDPALAGQEDGCWRGIRILGGDDWLLQAKSEEVILLNGIGFLPGSNARFRVYDAWVARGFSFGTLVHSRSWVEPSAVLGEGVQIMAGAIIQADVELGPNCIVNTAASVDHHCRIGASAHIAPGATLCGGVEVGQGAFVGAGATIVQGVRIGAHAVVPAGATVRHDLLP
jgi:sugar O-acyltransferase (sialic acid O-acetyltransferase NeuD family)